MRPLVDRGAVLDGIQRMSTIARSRNGAVCLLAGAAGMGKTHLARSFIRQLPADTVALAGAAPPTGGPPLLPICMALADYVPDEDRSGDEAVAVLEEHAASVPVAARVVDLLRARRTARRAADDNERGHLAPILRKDLRRALARLFPDAGGVRPLIHDADLPAEQIALTGAAEVMWFNILDEAEKRGPEALRRLVREAHERYPSDARLNDLWTRIRRDEKLIRRAPRPRRRRPIALGVAPSETYTFVVLARCIRTISERRPLVLFIDDVQWLDASSVAFLGFLFEQVGSYPFFLLIAARMNGVEPPALVVTREALGRLSGETGAQLVLPPLNAHEVLESVEQVLHGPVRFDTTDVDWLLNTSKGNPKHLIEVLALLRERDVLVEREGQWRLESRPDGLVVPSSLASITMSRFESALPPEPAAEDLLHLAAVMGRRFDARVLAQAAKIDAARAAAILQRLGQQTGYVVRDGKSWQFEFDHDVTREAVKGSLGIAEPDLHRRLAGVLASEKRAVPIEIALHHRAAGAYREAAAWYGEAATRAFADQAFHDAAERARTQEEMHAAAGSAVDSKERLDALALHARSLIAAERYSEAVAALRGRAVSPGGAAHTELLLHLGRASARLRDARAHHEAIEWLRRALTLAPVSPGETARIWTELVYAYDSVGDHAASQAAFRSAYSAAQRARDSAQMARLLRMTCIFWQPEKAAEAIEKALRLALQSHLPQEAALCDNDLGSTLLSLHQTKRAADHFEKSLARLSALGGHRTDAPLNNLAVIAIAEGRLDDADVLLARASDEAADFHNRLFIYCNRAVVAGMRGKVDQAIPLLSALAKLADANGDIYYRDCIRFNLGVALFSAGRPGDAIDAVTASPPRHVTTDEVLVLGQRARLLLRCFAALGQSPEPASLTDDAAALDRTTKPQAWLYRLDWLLCDIQFWED